MVKLNGEIEGPGVVRRVNGHGRAPLVLVVDDNPVITASLSRLLAGEGYRTSVCHMGADALRCAAEEPPVAALVDIHLPDISGLQLAQKLRGLLGPARPIIVLSGDTSMENLRSLPHVGADYFMSKPFNCGHLVERLRELVGASMQAER
jgi:DNA-binding response OmpR family regulator